MMDLRKMRGGELNRCQLLEGRFRSLKRLGSLFSPAISMIRAMISKGRTCDIEWCWTLNVVGKRRPEPPTVFELEEISNLNFKSSHTYYYKQVSIGNTWTLLEHWPPKLKRSSHISGVPAWWSVQCTQTVKRRNKIRIIIRLESRN